MTDKYSCVLIDGNVFASESNGECQALVALWKGRRQKLADLIAAGFSSQSIFVVPHDSPNISEVRKDSEVCDGVKLGLSDLSVKTSLMSLAANRVLNELRRSDCDEDTVNKGMEVLDQLVLSGYSLSVGSRSSYACFAPMWHLLNKPDHYFIYENLIKSCEAPSEPVYYILSAIEHANQPMLTAAKENGYFDQVLGGINGRPWAVLLASAASKRRMSSDNAISLMKVLESANVDICARSRYGLSAIDLAYESGLDALATHLSDASANKRVESNYDAFETELDESLGVLSF